ncbi:hypothetical protein LOTGIDRAFT_125016 [Lottia gigantea]|uniref:NAD-capped RNA hydrolase NUDT12 n=1 Tax=Lottia gigantea TaxID=225164 RepID=V4BLM9_LOTGI|nr:hypothetical protein LOTGIDRAFT_125016 [Lottia gigantea]ESO89644.1 hypothetical protein LOTGIDRAFT_125016 [Lottia gigantea]
MTNNVNWKNDRGWTSLMLAARNGHVSVVKTLVEEGCDVNILNSSGQTALDIAKFWNHQDVVDFLTGKSRLPEDSQLYNFYSRNPLYRAADKRKDSDWLDSTLKLETTNIIVFRDLNVFIVPSEEPNSRKKSLGVFKYVQLADYLASKPLVVFLGLETWDPHSAAWFAADVSQLDESFFKEKYTEGCFVDSYRSTMQLKDTDAGIFAEARSILAWHDRYKFCPTCGSSTVLAEAGYKRECCDKSCRSHNGVHNTNHPRVDPSMIMLIVSPSGKKCLLGRKKSFPPKMYSCLAGYMEPGESIEACCRREVEEESGIKVGQIEYHSSQPWPFPAVIMLGCIAYAKTDIITVDKEELEDAKWFSRQDIAAMATDKHPEKYFFPPPQAIAHQLIKSWLSRTSNL